MLLSIILIPLLGGALLPVFCKRGVRPAWYGLTLGALTFALALWLFCLAAGGAESSFSFALPLGFGLSARLDMLGAFMALAASGLSFIIIFYSTGYIHDADYEPEYYSVVLLFLGAMMGLVFSVNLVWLYVFWEITAICSWRLVGFFRKDEDKKKAVKTFLVTVGGSLFMMLGIAAVYFSNGSVDLTVLKGQHVPAAVCLLLITGMLSKSAILPFSTWLPDAGVAPSPVTALLHAAVLVKIGVYVFARVFYTVELDPAVGDTVMYVAAISTLIAGGAAIMETNIKRIIAYSTISQLGFIFFALASGTAAGLVAGMLFILMHGAAKGGLFLCAGIIEHKTHTKDINKMGGLYKTLPVTMVCFGLCALSVMGVPPLGGFFSKFLTFESAVTARSPMPVIVMFFIAAGFTAAYLLRVFHKVFLAEPAPAHKPHGGKEASAQMLISVGVLALLSLGLGLAAGPVIDFLVKTAAQMGVL
jgi:NADH:ubiquinone oxidoreductase subunit 5 (subunit L)/multisubunit Na+/H+ antiporter MnhA subunit